LKILICGSRTFNNYDKLKNSVNNVLKDLRSQGEKIFISGGAKGADTIAEEYALNNDKQFKCFSANWDKYGKRAGVIRNREMLEYLSYGDVVIAFWDGKSKGTKNMVEIAKKSRKNIKIFVFGD